MSIIGIGGVFFRSPDPDNLQRWYKEHLAINNVMHWIDFQSTPQYTVWNVFAENSKLFMDSPKGLIINYIVDNLKAVLERLKDAGVHSTGEIDEDENGAFAYIIDPERNKVILWEPSGRPLSPTSVIAEKVTGLGGVFFKSSNPKNLKEWYGNVLGLTITESGCNFQLYQAAGLNQKNPSITAWNALNNDSSYFSPGRNDFILCYCVRNLEALLKTLDASGVRTSGDLQNCPNGKLAWIIDPDGNKIELRNMDDVL